VKNFPVEVWWSLSPTEELVTPIFFYFQPAFIDETIVEQAIFVGNTLQPWNVVLLLAHIPIKAG
jgi:hypothetical protein